MKFKNVKPGDIIRTKVEEDKSNMKFQTFKDAQWKVLKIYRHVVLAESVKCPKIRRCFSYGDLVMLGIETQYIIR